MLVHWGCAGCCRLGVLSWNCCSLIPQAAPCLLPACGASAAHCQFYFRVAQPGSLVENEKNQAGSSTAEPPLCVIGVQAVGLCVPFVGSGWLELPTLRGVGSEQHSVCPHPGPANLLLTQHHPGDIKHSLFTLRVKLSVPKWKGSSLIPSKHASENIFC